MEKIGKKPAGKSKLARIWGKIWHFIWVDDSPLSWIVNIVLAFVIIKFLVYPGLGLLLGTSFPIVAVVSSSMEHGGQGFDDWWENNYGWYDTHGISNDQFKSFPMKNGFNKGDLIVLQGKKASEAKVGDVMVFMSSRTYPKPDPIIHRVVRVRQDSSDAYLFQTKGDNNRDSINNACDYNSCIDEYDIQEQQIVGYGLLRIPYLGYIKIWAVEGVNAVVTMLRR